MTKTGMICVKCGKNNASQGNSKYPYCKKCFKEEFNNNYQAYECKMYKEGI